VSHIACLIRTRGTLRTVVTGVLALAVASTVLDPSATAQDDSPAAMRRPFVLIDRGLVHQRIDLIRLDRDDLVYRTASDNSERRMPLDDCVAIRAIDEQRIRPSSGVGVIRLVDGQVLPGTIMLSAEEREDHVAWEHPWLGSLSLPLDVIRSVTLADDIETPADANTDVIQLSNGDRLEGFLIALGQPLVLEVQTPDGGASLIDIPLDRIAAVTMVTPDREPSGSRLWFRDGTIIDARDVRFDEDGAIRMQAILGPTASDAAMLRVSRLLGLLVAPGDVTPFATLQRSTVESSAERYYVPPPAIVEHARPLDLDTIELRGPIEAHFLLPPDATRFACELVLPASSRTWGDCIVHVRCDDTTVFETRLHHAVPTADINIPLQGAELTIEVQEGENGPVQDTVHIRNGLLLRAGS